MEPSATTTTTTAPTRERFVRMPDWWADELAELTPTRRASALDVLRTIATRANFDDGAGAYWTDPKLAEVTGMSERTVRDYRRVLAAAGLLTWTVVREPTGRTFTIYSVVLERRAEVERRGSAGRSGGDLPDRPAGARRITRARDQSPLPDQDPRSRPAVDDVVSLDDRRRRDPGPPDPEHVIGDHPDNPWRAGRRLREIGVEPAEAVRLIGDAYPSGSREERAAFAGYGREVAS